MKRRCKSAVLFVLLLGLAPQLLAQLPENISDRYIRVAEFGQLVDSINVWGDVNSAGRYLVPEGTNLPELLSYSFGFVQTGAGGGGRGNIDWTKTQIEIKVSRFDEDQRAVEVAYFRYLYHDPEPIEMWEFELLNNDVVTVRVRNKPSFNDYVSIVAPVISIFATSFLLIENLRN